MPSSHSPIILTVAFDDTHAVANAGLILTATLAARLGVEQLVDLGDRPATEDLGERQRWDRHVGGLAVESPREGAAHRPRASARCWFVWLAMVG
jgi:hypothetical protein